MLDIARTLSASASVHALTGSSLPGAAPVLTLGATAATQPACGHAGAPTSVHGGPNPTLLALVEEFEAKLAEADALAAAAKGVDCDEVPGWLELERRLQEISAGLYDIRAESMDDVLLVSRFLQIRWVRDDYEMSSDLVHNLAEDLQRLYGGAGPKAAAAEVLARPRAGLPICGHMDEAVIDLAERLKRLAAREDRLVLRASMIGDAVMKAMRPKPECRTMEKPASVDGRLPRGFARAVLDAEAEYEAALARWEERREEVAMRLRQPWWDKLQWRATYRLERWGFRLAAMQPATQAGLAAKAAAVLAVAIVENGELPNDWHQKLAISVSRDAVRLATDAPVMAQSEDPFTGFHAEILGLQAIIAATEEDSPEQEAAWTRWKEIDALVLASRPTTLAGALGALELARREHHRSSIEDRRNDEIGTDDRLIQHALDGALGVLRRMDGCSISVSSSLSPVPLPADPSALRLGADRAHDLREWYRSWLYGELRMLNLELDGTPETLAVRQDNPAAEFHFPVEASWRDVPKPSTRAAAVLGLLGLLPADRSEVASLPAASAA